MIMNKYSFYTSYFYDNIGQIIGKVDYDDIGNGRAYDAMGNYMGESNNGRTYNTFGELVAESDILTSLLVKEERIAKMVKVQKKNADSYDYYSIQPDEMSDLTDDKSYYERKGPQRGKYQLYQTVDTPFGEGRIVSKAVEYKPYMYGVKITSTDELEMVEEDDISIVGEKQQVASREITKYSAVPAVDLVVDAGLTISVDVADLEFDPRIIELAQSGKDVDSGDAEVGEILKDIAYEKLREVVNRTEGLNLKEAQFTVDVASSGINWGELMEEAANREATTKSAAKKSVGWLRDSWLKSSGKVLDALTEVSTLFSREYEDGEGKGIDLYKYYDSSRYSEVEDQYSKGQLSKDQAKTLLSDLVKQFKTELYANYEVSAKSEHIEDKESKLEEGPAYGSTNRYPYGGTGAGVPSSSHMRRLDKEMPEALHRPYNMRS